MWMGNVPLKRAQIVSMKPTLANRGVAASRFVGRQDLMAYKGLVLILGSMITIPMVWSM